MTSWRSRDRRAGGAAPRCASLPQACPDIDDRADVLCFLRGRERAPGPHCGHRTTGPDTPLRGAVSVQSARWTCPTLSGTSVRSCRVPGEEPDPVDVVRSRNACEHLAVESPDSLRDRVDLLVEL